MYEKLEKIKNRYDELTLQASNPEVISKREDWQKIVKERASLENIVLEYDKYVACKKEQESLFEIVYNESEKELVNMAKDELYELKQTLQEIDDELKVLLLPKDPKDNNNVIIEIRACAGGSEAGLFATELAKLYMKYAERNKWQIEEIDMNYTELGGLKDGTFMLSGKGAYAKLKYESGVHRVQRVPDTESQGRVHTSTVSVAVLPEAEDYDLEIVESDLRVDTYRSSGAGGQHVNTTDSAIRITHIPTGIVVTCQDERNQHKNKDKAMKVLKTKLNDHFQSIINAEYSSNRKNQIGTGDRSERIRTYNFPQGRVTDHRIGKTLYSLGEFMLGDIDDMVEALRIATQARLLASEESNN